MAFRPATRVQIKDFTMVVRDPDLRLALKPLDRDSNGTIDVAKDFYIAGGVSDDVRWVAFLQAVVTALNKGGLLKSAEQAKAFLNFLDLYRRVKRFHDQVEEWRTHGREVPVGKDRKDFLFQAQYCADHAQTFKTYGPRELSSMARDFLNDVHLLSGKEPPASPLISKHQTCPLTDTTYLTGFTYDKSAVPEPLREHVEQVGRWYMESAHWLFQYNSTACETVGGTERLGDLGSTDVLWWIEAGTENRYHTKAFKECPDS